MMSRKLRASANGQRCTLQIAGVCNHDPDTSVLCHLPDESHGMARKADDISAAIGCSDCHAWIDGGYSSDPLQGDQRDWYMRRAQVRTWRLWIELGLVNIA